MKYILSIVFLFFGIQAIGAQSLSGVVLDAATNEPLPFVAVYYGGTSIGTTTNSRGQFTIRKYEDPSATLNFRFVGYQSKSIASPSPIKVKTVRLEVEVGQLNAVVIDLDPWSREKKEIEFKRFFLGETSYARSARIKNFSKVNLRFNPSTRKLTASAREPVIVEHPYLGYRITYDLSDFEVEYILTAGPNSTNGEEYYYSSKALLNGVSFFEDLEMTEREKKRVERRRRKLYESSELYFLRSLVEGTTDANEYYLLQKRRKVNMNEEVRVRSLNGLYRIEFRENQYNIMDRYKHKSIMKLEKPYLEVSPYFHVIEPNSVLFAGFLGELKVTGILPLNYKYLPEVEDDQE